MSSIIRWDQILYFNHKNQKKNENYIEKKYFISLYVVYFFT